MLIKVLLNNLNRCYKRGKVIQLNATSGGIITSLSMEISAGLKEEVEKMYTYNKYGVNVNNRGDSTGDNYGNYWEPLFAERQNVKGSVSGDFCFDSL